MPLFFGYSNVSILEEYKKKQIKKNIKKKADKKKAEEAANDVIEHFRNHKSINFHKLKQWLDTYYKNNTHWRSDFCTLYKKCGFEPNTLLKNLRSSEKKYTKGLLSVIQDFVKKKPDVMKDFVEKNQEIRRNQDEDIEEEKIDDDE